MNDLTCIIPCYKEDPAIVTQTFSELSQLGAYVIVVDDGNSMDLPDWVRCVTYPTQMGYGYAIKHGLKYAPTSIACTLDGDGQHAVQDVKNLYSIYKLRNDTKMVVGQRWLNSEEPHRWVGRKLLNFIGSMVSGHYLSDMNSGLRIFDVKTVKDYTPILCDTFSFTTSLSISMVADGHRIAYFPIDVRPRSFGKSRVRLIKDGLVTLWYILFCGIGCRSRALRTWFATR